MTERVVIFKVPIHEEGRSIEHDPSAVLSPLQRLAFDRVEIIAVSGDMEAMQFANQVMTYLNTQGYDVKSIVNTSRPASGQYVEIVDGAARIVIGRRTL
tara:strand:- start:418 stop:714 length:297 start_codon:yes stop_codon:yes gene_type:complete